MISVDTDSDIELNDYEMSTDERSHLIEEPERMGHVTYTSDSEQSENGQVQIKTNSDTSQTATPCFVYVLSFFSAIGGFLFGYDTGVVSGAMLLLKDVFKLSSLMEEVIVSVTIGFAFLFALLGGILNDKFGRKITTIIASIVFTIGAGILAAAVNVEMLIAGRAVLGMGIGKHFAFQC